MTRIAELRHSPRYLSVEMALRRSGVVVPEIAEALGKSHNAAWRLAQRLVDQGDLYRTEERRRRPWIYGTGVPGAGGFVYRSRRRVCVCGEVMSARRLRDHWCVWRSRDRRYERRSPPRRR